MQETAPSSSSSLVATYQSAVSSFPVASLKRFSALLQYANTLMSRNSNEYKCDSTFTDHFISELDMILETSNLILIWKDVISVSSPISSSSINHDLRLLLNGHRTVANFLGIYLKNEYSSKHWIQQVCCGLVLASNDIAFTGYTEGEKGTIDEKLTFVLSQLPREAHVAFLRQCCSHGCTSFIAILNFSQTQITLPSLFCFLFNALSPFHRSVDRVPLFAQNICLGFLGIRVAFYNSCNQAYSGA